MLKYLEKVIHPRWPTPHEATKRLVGTLVAILSVSLVFIPIALSNIVPASVIALILLAYIEEDGLLLLVGLMAAGRRSGAQNGSLAHRRAAETYSNAGQKAKNNE